MKISIVTPNYNGARFLEQTLISVLAQRAAGVDVEYIVIDGGSRDESLDILHRYSSRIDHIVSEPDQGPASAINKGLAMATGDVLGWLNADDVYHEGALRRALDTMAAHPHSGLCFGRCRITDEDGKEVRRGITRFKETFYPVSCRFVIQTINYISQPAMFFRRSALERVGPLRTDMEAAFDYEFILRLWRQGGACRVPGPPLADFRWHPSSISGRRFRTQFREELEAARRDAGRFSPQTLLHGLVRWGIVGAYTVMTTGTSRSQRE